MYTYTHIYIYAYLKHQGTQQVISEVINTITPVKVPITLLTTYLLSPLRLHRNSFEA